MTRRAAVAKYVATIAAMMLATENAERGLARLAVVHDFGLYPLHSSLNDRTPARGHFLCRGSHLNVYTGWV